jgi:tRNA A-37 threonylcarbamoyl transferase component Bud32
VCLDDDAISAYASRHMTERERTLAEEHLSSCELCLALACAAARDHESEAPGPRRIGRYEVRELLGEGAMGSVYAAHDPQLDRRVAIKLVRSDRQGHAELHARLAREAKTLAQVRHPNVVAVHDAGQLDDGVFIAMELVEGETLRRWLLGGRRPWRDIVAAFAQAGRGLAAAHAAGIVHRDFKPDNVIVERTGRVVVGDFGVAAAAGDESAVAGTLRYMAPEQLEGRGVDARADQYAFATALWEALFNELPFPPGTQAGVSGKSSPQPPRGTPVPPALARVLWRALSRAPSARFPDMGALLEALERSLRPRRTRALLGVAAGAAAMAVGLWVAWPTTHRPPPPAGLRTRLLVGAFENRTGLHELDGTVEALMGELASTSERIDTTAGIELSALAARLQADETDVDAIAAKVSAGDPRPIVTVRGVLTPAGDGRVTLQVTAGPFHEARTFGLADARDTVADLTSDLLVSLGEPPVAPGDRAVLSPSLPAIAAWLKGQREVLAGDQKAAEGDYRKALELDPELTDARASLGLTLYNENRKGEGIPELERAFAAADRIPQRKRLTFMGDYYGTAGRFGESILAYQQLLAKWPGDARTQINLVATAIDANSWPLALDAAKAAVRDHASIEVARRNLVIAEVGNQQLDDAARDGLLLLKELPNPSGPAATATMIALALRGRLPEARALAPKVPDDLAALAQADLAAYEGRLDDAEAALAGRDGAADQQLRAWIKLLRGDKSAALAAARLAMAEPSMPAEYLGQSAALEAGDATGAAEKVRAWSDMPESDHRMYAQLLAGDLARAKGRWDDALNAYRAAGRLGDSWLVHERTWRAARGKGDAVLAGHERAWCKAHSGQGALVANPSLTLLRSLEDLPER